ncbi:MAG: hypothetical protein ABIJ37_02055 [Pseudomonadota bacterium]
MKIKQRIILSLFSIVAVFIVFGCASVTKELLAEDYKTMSNDDLLRYFYRLNDEIESSEKESGPRVSIGIGSFGRHIGGALGINTGSGGSTAEELRARRIDVRMELNKRGITP